MSGTGLPPPGSLQAILRGLTPKGFLHLTFGFDAPALTEEVQERVNSIINTADDWLKYAANCWLLWSAESPKEWYDKFAAIPELKGSNIFIIRIDVSPSNRYGQMGNVGWDWMNKKRQ